MEYSTGFHEMPAAEYHTIDAVSNSLLTRFDQSPAACKVKFKETPAMMLGIAVHDMFLEPDDFIRRWMVLPYDTRATVAAKTLIKLEEEKLGRRSLTTSEFIKVDGMTRSLRQNPTAVKLLRTAIAVEETAFWHIDMEPNRLCKGRKDLVGDGWIADVKSTGQLAKFRANMGDRGYVRQAAWYMLGDKILGRPASKFHFIVVANKEPYETKVITLGDLGLQAGEDDVMGLFERYMVHEATDNWTSALPDEVMDPYQSYLNKHLGNLDLELESA